MTEITLWHWSGFVSCIVLFLALDLGVFHRRARVVTFREALLWTVIWFGLAMLFAFGIAPAMAKSWQGQQTLEFTTAYTIELSLSMDNVFVIAVIFAYFRVADRVQHRVLFWGVLGALVMRGVVIGLGVALVQKFDWVLLVLGGFLIVSGLRMIFVREKAVRHEQTFAVRLARRIFPIAPDFDGQKFLTRHNGLLALTPLALVLLLVETTDLVFALDSIPATFAVTTDPFIVFTANVFAILGLRSLYFVLAGAIQYFHFLKLGLSVVLVFVGAKMLLARWAHISTPASLTVVLLILAVSILASVATARRETKV